MIIIPLFECDKINQFFIKIDNKFLIEFCLESIILKDIQILFILNESDCYNFSIDQILQNLYPKSIIKKINKSNSILDTLLQVKKIIPDDKFILIYAPPFTYFEPKFSINMIQDSDCNLLLFKTNNNKHCYVNFNEDKIISLAEKKIISKYALLGLYIFKNKKLLFQYFNKFDLKKNWYLSDLLQEFLLDNKLLKYKIIDLVYPFKDTKTINYLKTRVLKKKLVFGISSDHSGFNSKTKFIKFFKKKNIKYVDYGCYTNKDCDYNDYIEKQYEGYKNSEFNFGISICRSGQGVNISANHAGFISALVYNKWSAQMGIEHNNCNFYCLSDKLIENNTYTVEEIIDIIYTYKFLGGRFLNRLLKVENV